MSDRRRIPRVPRSSRPPSRRRAATALAAAVLLVVVAGIVGSQVDRDDSPGSTQSSAAGISTSSEGTAGGDAPARSSAGDELARAEEMATDLDAKADNAGSSSRGVAEGEPTGQPVPPSDTSGGAGSGGAGQIAPKVIRTGSVELVVKRGTFADAVTELTTLASGVGGFVSASQTTQLGDDPRGTITLRVPAKDFDRVLARVAKVGEVDAATTGSQDVTGEYTDVGARIRALEDEREQIRLVLSRAETIPDILSVRDRLAAVQSELEQLQGRRQVLDDQTSLSTLTISLREKGAASTVVPTRPEERSGIAALWHDAAERFGDGVRSIALGSAVLAPWLLLGLVLWLPLRVLWRRFAGVPAAAATAAPVDERTPVA